MTSLICCEAIEQLSGRHRSDQKYVGAEELNFRCTDDEEFDGNMLGVSFLLSTAFKLYLILRTSDFTQTVSFRIYKDVHYNRYWKRYFVFVLHLGKYLLRHAMDHMRQTLLGVCAIAHLSPTSLMKLSKRNQPIYLTMHNKYFIFFEHS